MKISEAIKKLQEIQKKHGDLEIMNYSDPWYDGYYEPMTKFYIKFNKNNKQYIGC